MMKAKKIILVPFVAIALLAVCLALILLLAPLLINTETVRSKVGAWIEEKTDSTVKFQRIDLRFFPLPRVAVSRVYAGIPDMGAVSAESVTAYLSLFPLISGKVDISRIRIEHPKISLDLTPPGSAPEKTTEKRMTGEALAGLAEKFPGIVITVDDGEIDVSRKTGKPLVLNKVNARFYTQSGNINADLSVSAGFARKIQATARVEKADSAGKISLLIQGTDVDVALFRETALLFMEDNPVVRNVFSYLRGGKVPEISVMMTGGKFAELGGPDDLVIKGRLRAGRIFVSEADLSFQNATGDFSVSDGILRGESLSAGLGNAEIKNSTLIVGLKGADAPFHLASDIKMNFKNVPELLDHFMQKRPFPLDRLKYARGVVTGRLILGESVAMFSQWKKNGRLRFDGRVSAADGLTIDLALTVSPKAVEITKLNIRDSKSNAVITVSLGDRTDRVSFSGHLERKTVDKLIYLPYLPEDFAEGDIKILFNTENILLSTVYGRISAGNVQFRLKNRIPFELKQVKLIAEGSHIVIESALVQISDNTISLKGAADVSSQRIFVDMDASAESIRWDTVRALFAEAEEDTLSKISVAGSVKLKTGTFHYGNVTFSPVRAGLTLSKGLMKIAVEDAAVKVGDDFAAVHGFIDITPKTVAVDLDAMAENLKWEALKTFLTKAQTQPGNAVKKSADRTLTGSVQLVANTVFLGTKKIGPAHAMISFLPDMIRVNLPDIIYCGIRAPGSADITGDTIATDFSLSAVEQDLEPTLDCLTGDRSDITGKFVLKGNVGGRGKADKIVQTLNGGIDFKADGGRINRSLMLLNIYSLLNVSGYLSGNLTDLFRKGITYRFITLKADIRDGRMIITEASLDAPSMQMVATGEIDLVTEKIDLRMLAIPLTTIDIVLGKVPLIGKALRGALVSVPVTVTGDLSNPVVTYSAASGIGSGLINLMKKIVEFPFTIVEPNSSEKTPAPAVKEGK
jgi:hypothetical protein